MFLFRFRGTTERKKATRSPFPRTRKRERARGGARTNKERERVETRSNFFLLRFSSFSVSLAKATRALLKRETFSRVTHTEKISRFVSKIPNI